MFADTYGQHSCQLVFHVFGSGLDVISHSLGPTVKGSGLVAPNMDSRWVGRWVTYNQEEDWDMLQAIRRRIVHLFINSQLWFFFRRSLRYYSTAETCVYTASIDKGQDRSVRTSRKLCIDCASNRGNDEDN